MVAGKVETTAEYRPFLLEEARHIRGAGDHHSVIAED
jgi:hypothetical protein